LGSFKSVEKSSKFFWKRKQPGKIDSPLNKKLQEVKWGEFRIGDLFEKLNLKFLKDEFDKERDVSKIRTDEFSLPLVNAKDGDNGIMYYGREQDFETSTMTIDIVNDGAVSTGNVYPQPQKTGVLYNAYLIKPNFQVNTNILHFFTTSIFKSIKHKYGYENKAGWEKVKNENIQLPITSTGEIDFAFMEKFISELEEERISELSAYLEVTGLKDYTLTTEEENALKDFEEMEWGEFEIGDLFDFLTSKKRFDANKVTILENGNYPYIVRTSLNNGTKGYLNENEEYLNSGNTISFGQDTATIFYQKEPYFTGDKIKIVKAKDDLFNAKNALYFLTSMNKSFQVYSWGSSSFNVDILSKEKMFLPLQNNSLNYPFMETFISAIQKLVIKDVVLYADKKINATKIITNKP